MSNLIQYFDHQILVKINEEYRERDKELWSFQNQNIVIPPFLNIDCDTEVDIKYFIKSFDDFQKSQEYLFKIKELGHQVRYLYKKEWLSIKSFEE